MHAPSGRLEQLARRVAGADQGGRRDAMHALLRARLHHLLFVGVVLGPPRHHRVRLPLHILQGGFSPKSITFKISLRNFLAYFYEH